MTHTERQDWRKRNRDNAAMLEGAGDYFRAKHVLSDLWEDASAARSCYGSAAGHHEEARIAAEKLCEEMDAACGDSAA